jgi:hypothetical protein
MTTVSCFSTFSNESAFNNKGQNVAMRAPTRCAIPGDKREGKGGSQRRKGYEASFLLFSVIFLFPLQEVCVDLSIQGSPHERFIFTLFHMMAYHYVKGLSFVFQIEPLAVPRTQKCYATEKCNIKEKKHLIFPAASKSATNRGHTQMGRI